MQLWVSYVPICVVLTCNNTLLWNVKHILLLHLNMQYLSKSNPFFLHPYKGLICLPVPKVSPCDFPSHSQIFFFVPQQDIHQQFFVWLKRWGNNKALIYCSHPGKSSNIKHPSGKATMVKHQSYKEQHANLITMLTQIADKPHRHPNAFSYLQDAHDGDQYAATLQWAFQHFWSDQQQGHSSPQSQYLHREMIKYARLKVLLK